MSDEQVRKEFSMEVSKFMKLLALDQQLEEGVSVEEAMDDFNKFSDWVIANHKTKEERENVDS